VTVFVLTTLIGVGVIAGVSFASSHTNPTQTAVPGPYSAQGNETETAAPPGALTPAPLPAALVGSVPGIGVLYDNMPFWGELGSYCWAGIATTNQTTTASARTCVSNPMPADSSGLPTIAVYPNASISFEFSDQQYPNDLQASLFQSGSMKLVSANASAIGGLALGSLPTGDYVLSLNASFDRSFTSAYYGIKQIDSVNFSEGSIKISIGSPMVDHEGLSDSASGGPSETFVGLESWPLTISSPTVVRDVNLTAISVISGDWVRFFPSYLPEVGPNGTAVNMLLNGAVRPFVNNDISNVTMIIQATATGGSTGQVALPLEDPGSSIVLHSLAAGQEFEGAGMMVFAANQTNFGIESIIYDPPSAVGNQSLPVTVSIAGFYDANGTVVPQPSWLQFSAPPAGLSITPYQPLYFPLPYQSTGAAPLGYYTLVVDVQVGSGSLSLFIPVSVNPPIFAGPAG
jgi:hypothetical protein